MSLLKSIFKRSATNRPDNEYGKSYDLNGHHSSSNTTSSNIDRRRAISNTDNHKTKKLKKKRKKKRKNKHKHTDVKNYHYNGADDNDDNKKSDTFHSSTANTESTDSIIVQSQSVPTSAHHPHQQWIIHKSTTTPPRQIQIHHQHPITNSSNNSNYGYCMNEPQSPRPQLTLNRSIAMSKMQRASLIKQIHLEGLKTAEQEFQRECDLIMAELESVMMNDHLQSTQNTIVHRVRCGVYLPSSALKSYISKLRLTTYRLQGKIEMINEILSILEDGYLMTYHVLTNINYTQSISPEIPHIIYQYICDDFLVQAPFLRINLCDRIRKFYKTEYLKQQTDLIDSIVDSTNSCIDDDDGGDEDGDYIKVFDARYRYYATIEVHIKVAVFWWNCHEFERACFYVKRSLQTCDMRDIRRAKLNYMLAHIYQFHVNQYKLSRKHYETAIQQNETHSKSLFEFAYLLDHKLSDKEQAKLYYMKHIELIENNPKNIIQYDIDNRTPKLSIFYGNDQLIGYDSIVWKSQKSLPVQKQRTPSLSQSVSIESNRSKFLNFASVPMSDATSEDPDVDLSDIKGGKLLNFVSVPIDDTSDNGLDEDIKDNDNNDDNDDTKYAATPSTPEPSSHKKKVNIASSPIIDTSSPSLKPISLSPINSGASIGSTTLPLPLRLCSSGTSASKSFHRKFEDEENGFEIEVGIDLNESMAEQSEMEQKLQQRQKALLSMDAIEEEEEFDESINYKTDDEGDMMVLMGIAHDEIYGVDVGANLSDYASSDNEMEEKVMDNKNVTERTGIGTTKNKKKIDKESRLRLAEIYAEEDDNVNARIQYEALLDHDDDNFSAILGYANFLQFNIADYKLSEFYYQKAIKVYTSGNVLLNENIKTEKGIELFVKYGELLINDDDGSRKDEVFEIIDEAKQVIICQLHHKLLLEFGEILCDVDHSIYIDKAIECFQCVLDSNSSIYDKQYHYDAYLELGRIYYHHKNDLKQSYEYFMEAIPLNHAKQDWHLHFELSMLMSDQEFVYQNIKLPLTIARDHARKSLRFCNDAQDKRDLKKIYKSLSLIV